MLCCIDSTVMHDPVRISGEKQLYERTTLLKIMKRNAVSPFTRKRFALKNIKRDRIARRNNQKAIACTVNEDIIYARKMNCSKLEDQLYKDLCAADNESDKVLALLKALLDDASQSDTNRIRRYCVGYVATVQHDLRALLKYREAKGFYTLANANIKPHRFGCFGFLCGFERDKSRKNLSLVKVKDDWFLGRFYQKHGEMRLQRRRKATVVWMDRYHTSALITDATVHRREYKATFVKFHKSFNYILV